MSMLTLTGQLINIFESPKGVSKKTGEEYGGQDKVQLLGEVQMENGSSRNELLTLSTHNVEYFSGYVGKRLSVPIGAFPNGETVQFFIPKGSKPEVAKEVKDLSSGVRLSATQ